MLKKQYRLALWAIAFSSIPVCVVYALVSAAPGASENQPVTVITRGLRQNPPKFDKLKASHLETYPETQTKIIPALKSELLKLLLSRFSETDWKNWPRSEANTSSAREFVDSVSAVNMSLGSYLETAGQVFYDLNQETNKGKPYFVADGIRYITTHAQEILKSREKTIVPAQFVFTDELIEDPSFHAAIETLRGELISNYLRKNPKAFGSGMELIYTIGSTGISKELLEQISLFAQRVALQGSRQERETILYEELRTKHLNRFALLDSRVRRSLAELFVMGAIDSLQSGDSIQAAKFLRESSSLEPGLRVQELARARLESTARTEQVGKEGAPGTENQRLQAEGGGELSLPIIGSVFFLCAIAPLITYFVLSEGKRFRQKKRYQKAISVLDNDFPRAANIHGRA